jgi:hypothetical protein
MRFLLTGAAVVAATPLWAAAPAGTVVALWTTPAPQRGEIPEAMPARFLLLEDGTVYVGGTSEVTVGHLEKKDVKAIEKQLERVRKMPVFGGPQAFGPGDQVYRLSIRKGGDVVARGDPARAPGALGTLADLVEWLAAYDHPSLRPFTAPSLLLAARETPLPGGCRSWSFPVALPDVLKQPRTIGSAQAAGWPTGATPAVVCDSGRRYAVTLRPLLPGENP